MRPRWFRERVTGMRKREHHPLSSAVSLIVCGLLAGVVVAAVAFPAVAMSGLGMKAAAESFDKLPADIDVAPAPQISYVFASDATTLLEMKYAIALEKKISKQEILERYLNIASFGHRAWGIFAASQVYFGKEPKDLTLGEAALLAGVLKGPTKYDPATPEGLKNALERRDTYVLPQMARLGYATQAQVDDAKKTPLKIV